MLIPNYPDSGNSWMSTNFPGADYERAFCLRYGDPDAIISATPLRIAGRMLIGYSTCSLTKSIKLGDRRFFHFVLLPV